MVIGHIVDMFWEDYFWGIIVEVLKIVKVKGEVILSVKNRVRKVLASLKASLNRIGKFWLTTVSLVRYTEPSRRRPLIAQSSTKSQNT